MISCPVVRENVRLSHHMWPFCGTKAINTGSAVSVNLTVYVDHLFELSKDVIVYTHVQVSTFVVY